MTTTERKRLFDAMMYALDEDGHTGDWKFKFITDYIDKIEGGQELTDVNRLEVINHAENSHGTGRLLTMYKSMGDFSAIELDFQDDGKTLKIFIS